MRSQIQEIQRSRASGKYDRSQGTIFTELMDSDLPPQELLLDRLMDEAAGVVGAGIETTKWATVVTVFHIINNPSVLRRLRQDLKKAISDPRCPPGLTELDQMPYLMACIEEGKSLVAASSQFASLPQPANGISCDRPSALVRRRSTVAAYLTPQAAPVSIVDHPFRRTS